MVDFYLTEESNFLRATKDIFANESKSESSAAWNIEWTPDLAVAIADRFDGVTLLSEALSAGNEDHQYREFARFFELAFGLAFYDKRLARKLTQFLSSSPRGYNRDEINNWASLRHPATHADLGKSEWIAISPDIRHVVLRMHQACLDVLFSKVKLRDASSSRREIWNPDAITTSSSGHLVAVSRQSLGNVITLLKPVCFDKIFIELNAQSRLCR